MKKCKRNSARKQTHGQRQHGFTICPTLYAIAMGQIAMPIIAIIVYNNIMISYMLHNNKMNCIYFHKCHNCLHTCHETTLLYCKFNINHNFNILL